jgi:asparagine synthase (glutamine-hydrolysing)
VIITKNVSIHPQLNVVIDSNYRKLSLLKGRAWLRSNFSKQQTDKLIERLNSTQPTTLEGARSFLRDTSGNFSLIVYINNVLFASVDKIRTFPLYIKKENALVSILGRPREQFSEVFEQDIESWNPLSMSSYTIGRRTLHKDISGLRAGEFLYIDSKNFPLIESYYIYSPWKFDNKITLQSAKTELTDITLKLLGSIAQKHKGKKIIIPLSAGVDSRLIASGFRELGIKNISCISYGQKGNFEATAAKKIAKQLGYDWHFIELDKQKFSSFKSSKDFQNYHFFCESLTSVPFYQDIVALRELKKIFLPKETIIINGNSGDFISGGHILESLTSSNNREESTANIIQETIQKHFSLWKSLKNSKNLKVLEKQLSEEIDFIYGIDSLEKPGWAIYECLEFLNRQTKYVISGQWNYDFMGFSWELPLWSEEYLHFWQKVPYEFKNNQKLYKDWSLENNWGGVWKDIPINQKFPYSTSLKAIRLLAKLACSPLGKSNWHSIEKKLFSYHTEILGLHGDRKYRTMLFEKDEPRNILSWLTRDYLAEIVKYAR